MTRWRPRPQLALEQVRLDAAPRFQQHRCFKPTPETPSPRNAYRLHLLTTWEAPNVLMGLGDNRDKPTGIGSSLAAGFSPSRSYGARTHYRFDRILRKAMATVSFNAASASLLVAATSRAGIASTAVRPIKANEEAALVVTLRSGSESASDSARTVMLSAGSRPRACAAAPRTSAPCMRWLNF